MLNPDYIIAGLAIGGFILGGWTAFLTLAWHGLEGRLTAADASAKKAQTDLDAWRLIVTREYVTLDVYDRLRTEILASIGKLDDKVSLALERKNRE